MSKFFVAGTDTGVGKSIVSAGLLKAASDQGKTTLGLKPIAAGCDETPEGLRNEDAVLLQQYSTEKVAYELVNPIALKEPMAPHIAAAREGKRLSIQRTVGYVRGAMTTKAGLTLVEGAGGWRVPLNQVENMGHLVKALDLPVILVVGIRLGCINHALLTAETIVRDGVKIAGWVANMVEPDMLVKDENIGTLRAMFRFPLLGEIPYLPEPSVEAVAEKLDLSLLETPEQT